MYVSLIRDTKNYYGQYLETARSAKLSILWYFESIFWYVHAELGSPILFVPPPPFGPKPLRYVWWAHKKSWKFLRKDSLRRNFLAFKYSSMWFLKYIFVHQTNTSEDRTLGNKFPRRESLKGNNICICRDSLCGRLLPCAEMTFRFLKKLLISSNL